MVTPIHDQKILDAWLAEVARWEHQTTAGAPAPAGLPDATLVARMAAVFAGQDQARTNTLAMIAATPWQAAGGDGGTPELLRQTVNAYLSGLFTQAVLRDA